LCDIHDHDKKLESSGFEIIAWRTQHVDGDLPSVLSAHGRMRKEGMPFDVREIVDLIL
jgi:hypothetical protein